MNWNPTEGFHLEAFVERRGAPEPDKIEFWKPRIIRKQDRRSIRMKVRHGAWAIAPNVPLIDLYSVIDEDRLSINLPRIVFIQAMRQRLEDNKFAGSALYASRNWMVFPDVVKQEVRIKGETISEGSSAAGLSYADHYHKRVIGRLNDNKQLELYWTLTHPDWTKASAWQWAEGASDALSILSGTEAQLLQRTLYRGNRIYTDIRRQTDKEDLRVLTLLNETDRLDKGLFIRLAAFFANDKEHSSVCRNILKQMFEAVHQKSWQASELFIATILEAALRNIDNAPFQVKKGKNRQWSISDSLDNFRKRYFSDDWIAACQQALRAHFYLRDKNAHPDWLFTQGGSLSDEETEKSLDQMIFLSRFYGYMILAVVGVKDLKPVFPKPHKEWRPMMVRSIQKDD